MRILVVDDHAPTIELMELTLTSVGHSVRSATTVAEALEIAAGYAPHVILSDLTFSSVAGGAEDGHSFARAVRAEPDHVGVAMLAITGVVSPSELQAAIDSGFDDVVVKPFDVEALIGRIDELGRAVPDQ
ncbi:MAG: response regulator [Acidimicrobiales bacterium]